VSGREAAWAMLDASDQAELVKRGLATPRDLVSAAIERIERLDGEIGAIPVRSFAEALAAADRATSDAPFVGVPFLLKDVGARQGGQPYYAGNRSLRDADHRAKEDTLLGARFRDLGLVTLGNSNTPEFGLQSNTWPLAYGPACNPWDTSRSAGGSSGGACAAVSAGLVPVAHASDGAGSIRIPAAWCGIVGLKPSRDRIAWRHRGTGRSDVEFVVARSLRDTATFLDLLRPERDRRASPRRYRDCLDGETKRLRVAVCVRPPGGGPIDAECAAATREVAETLAQLGHEVVEDMPDTFDDYETRSLYGALIGSAEYRSCLSDLEARLGRPVAADDVEPFLWHLAWLEEAAVSDAEIEEAIRWNDGWIMRTTEWFRGIDLLLTPTVPEAAPPLAELHPERHEPLELLAKMVRHMVFTEAWNATGQPAITLPWRLSSAGLPLGVQLVAGPGGDALLISMAARLLADRPDLRPPLHA
jgi:amidase